MSKRTTRAGDVVIITEMRGSGDYPIVGYFENDERAEPHNWTTKGEIIKGEVSSDDLIDHD